MLLILGCQKYRAKPIDSQKIVSDADLSINQAKQMIPPDEPITFKMLLDAVSQNNVDLQLIKTQYLQQVKYAKTKAPIANPQIGLGLKKGFNVSDVTQNLTQPFVTLGFTIPLWGKRKLAQELEFKEADATQQEYVILHRNIYLELRQIYTNIQLNTFQLNLLKDLLNFLELELKLADKQLMQGQLSLLDLGHLTTELEQTASDKLDIEHKLVLLFSKLSSISGLPSKVLPQLVIPPFEILTGTLPSRETALKLLVENSPVLNRLHAKYDIAEKALELEIRKQYPDLKIDSGFEKEPGVSANYLGISLGMELPIFDRNQKGILLAHQKREQILFEYQLQARQAILEIDNALEMIKSAELQISFIQNKQLNTYSKNYELAKREYQINQIKTVEMISVRKEFYEAYKVYIGLLEIYYQHCVTLSSTLGTALFDQGNLLLKNAPHEFSNSKEIIETKESSNDKK